MRTMMLLALVACNTSSASAPTHNVAEDTVLYVEPKAKCERVVTSDDYDSVRCEVPSGAKVYCTASSAGFVCQALNQGEAKK